MKKTKRKFRNFAVLRSYNYETHDKDGNLTNDITEAEWRDKVIFDINSLYDNSEVSEIFYVFHDSTIRGLHVHLVVTFKNSHSRTFAFILLMSNFSFNRYTPYFLPCDRTYVDFFRSSSSVVLKKTASPKPIGQEEK